MKEKIGIIGHGKIAAGLIKALMRRQIEPLVLVRNKHKYSDYKNLTDSYRTISTCTIIIEAIAEDFEQKVEVYKSLRPNITANTIIATTTSSLSVEKLAKSANLESQFVGLHFFNPTHVIKFLEVIPSSQFKPELLSRINLFLLSISYDYVVIPDIPGFVANRLLFPQLLDAVELHSKGIPDNDINSVMKQALRHPLGPFELLDLIGFKTADRIVRNLFPKRNLESWDRYWKEKE